MMAAIRNIFLSLIPFMRLLFLLRFMVVVFVDEIGRKTKVYALRRSWTADNSKMETKNQTSRAMLPGGCEPARHNPAARVDEHSSSQRRDFRVCRYFAPALASTSATFGWLSRLAYIMAE